MLRTFAAVLALSLAVPSARAGCDWLDRLCFSAASPGYPAQEFWAPRLYRLHACHEPRSVSVSAPSRCDVAPNFVPVGPYCGGSQPHFPIGGTAHQAGTIRFGTDARTSALDLNCKAHELDNLYVVDASFFVSIGAVNPTLTIIANALRVGDHLQQRLR